MRYLLDTDHASYLQRGHPAVVQHLKSLPPDAEVFISVVTQAELLTGIQLAPSEQRRIELRRLYEWLVSEISDPLPITPDVAEQFAEVSAQLIRKGKPIPTNDIWIAAIALAYGLILVTSDEHFQHIDGLQVEDWKKPEQSD
jgi:predicted nucleic acid-binding protein